ncbi:MAG: glycosyltransferase, partial [Myxococcota bacterium]|nr:glycosyltransferase [Myxococcota bacterium]
MATRIPVYVFAKPPVAGAVKTRLVPAVSAQTAAALASAFLVDTCAALHPIPWAAPHIATTGALPPELARGIPRCLQGDGDLGARLERILRPAIA